MKTLGHKNIWALACLLLAGTIITSASALSPKSTSEAPAPEAILETIEVEDDFSYMEDIDAYVDKYLESMVEEEDASIVKIYDENGVLILSEDISENELSEEGIRLLRKAEFLTEYDDTTYYRLNS